MLFLLLQLLHVLLSWQLSIFLIKKWLTYLVSLFMCELCLLVFFFVIAGLITISVSDTATNDMAGFLPDYPKVVGGAATGFGFICIIASFLINHLFGSEEERSNTQDAAEQAKVKGLTK